MKVENLPENPQAELVSHIGASHRYFAAVGVMKPWDARMEADQQIRQVKLKQLTTIYKFKKSP